MPDDDFDELEDDQDPEDRAGLRKQLRAASKERDQARRQLEQLQRDTAFLKAGVPETKQSAYFIKGYDGEMNPEAIRQAAVEAGFITEQSSVPADEQAAHERIADASAGANVPQPQMAQVMEKLAGIDVSGRDPFAANKIFEVMKTEGLWQGVQENE